MKNFADLTEREVLAVAIPAEEEASRICMSFAGDLMNRYPDAACIFERMARRKEPSAHASRNVRTTVRSQSAAGSAKQRQEISGLPFDLADQKSLARCYPQKSRNNGVRGGTRLHEAAEQVRDVGVRKLLGDLGPDVRAEEDKTRKRIFVLQYVQPGLAGLMDGSVSTLAALRCSFRNPSQLADILGRVPASAWDCRSPVQRWTDDGRGSPWLRGAICGTMTTVGGLGHTLPYLVPDAWVNGVWIATAIADVVFFELRAIAYIRTRYMDAPFLQAVFQIVLGGAIALAAAVEKDEALEANCVGDGFQIAKIGIE